MLEIHPVANLFPSMGEVEFAGLKADIAENGLLDPIWVWQGRIIDGRHRARACEELGIECATREWDGEEASLITFVVGLNLHRRHLNESQRALVAARIANMAVGNPAFANPANLPDSVKQRDAAELLNVSERSIRDVKRVERERPELLADIESGKLAVGAAIADIKKDARVSEIREQENQIKAARPGAPSGLFHVIVIDPPWPYRGAGGSIEDYDPIGRRAANPYPEESLEALAARSLPAADDCVLWLWTTHQFMRHAYTLLDAWRFEEKVILTWCKDRMGLGRWLRSQSEFCIMAVRGKPPVNLTNQTTVLQAPMREHSRKPDEFYAMVDELCVGRKLDYFSREQRLGWEQFGNDPEKFAA